MRKIVVLLLTILFIIQPSDAEAVTNQTGNTLSLMDQLADEALQLTKSERYDDTKIILEKFENLLNDNSYYALSLTMDEWRILQLSVTEASKIITNEDFTEGELVNSLTKMRLAVDAVATEYEPLWTAMEQPVMASFQTVKAAVMDGDTAHFYDQLNAFLSLYEVIYPSIKLDVSVEKVQQLDAQIQYIQQYSDELFASADGIKEMEALQTNLESLFENVDEDEADPSLWWVIISTGGIIILTLSYVGWRKFKAEKESKQQFEKEHKN
ncbi:sporulation protein YpjB [Caldibacillus lycopersici]|uniref:Sporulation protein YpjB n=1 Tax=Perspicuibacillus lycopersici TaxID=1325689 RepID=A0AAE3ISK3_9BACI|nr:sporulation protein YpjB [Perspicuibacillus lycopersici]MCU9613696.1 sporulation protein YpjB [Perspicuibacillus lycopersici]